MVDINEQLALRIGGERALRNWSQAELARRAEISKSMLSKIERQEVSATAAILMRIATAFGMTLAELLTPTDAADPRVARAKQQAVWTDPETGYSRRQVYLGKSIPLELVEVSLPAQAKVEAPALSYAFVRQVIWVLAGKLTVKEGEQVTELQARDRLELGPPAPRTYANASDRACNYLIALVRQ